MHRKLPSGRASHAEAAHHDAIVVDGVEFLGVFEGFQGVDLTSEFVRAAITTVGMQHDGVFRLHIADLLRPLIDESKLTERLTAAMAPDVGANRGSDIGIGNDKPVGLHATVDL